MSKNINEINELTMMSIKSLSGSGHEQQVQRPCGRDKLDGSKGQKVCFRRVSECKVNERDKAHRRGSETEERVQKSTVMRI